MQQIAAWLRSVPVRPRSTVVLIACLTGLALATSALSNAVNGPPATAIPGSGNQSAQTTNVTVTLGDSTIASSQTIFTPGMRYHFTVVNKGTIDHEMMLLPQVIPVLSSWGQQVALVWYEAGTCGQVSLHGECCSHTTRGEFLGLLPNMTDGGIAICTEQ
jgi:hypothetical protein